MTTENNGWEDVPSPAAPQPAAEGGWEDVPPASAPPTSGWEDVPTPVSEGSGQPGTTPPGAAQSLQAGSPSEPDKRDYTDIDARGEQGGDGVITDDDLDYLSKKHGVARDDLRSKVGWLSGILDPASRQGSEHVTEALKSTVGAVGSAVVGGNVGKLITKSYDTPQERAALDDLRRLISKRKSLSQDVGDVLTGVAAPIGLVKKGAGAALVAAEAAGMGAAFGYGSSDETNELESTLIGAGVGAGFVGAASAASKLIGKFASKTTPETRAAVLQAEQDSVGAAREAMAANRASEETLARTILESPDVREAVRTKDSTRFASLLTDEQASAIAKLAPDADIPEKLVKEMGDTRARAWSVLREEVQDLDKMLGVGTRKGGVRDVIAQEGLPDVTSRFLRQRESKYAAREFAKLAEEKLARPGFFAKAAAVMSDARYVTDAIDRRLGSRLTPSLDRLSGAFNQFTSDLSAAARLQKGLNRALLRAEKELTTDGQKFSMFDALQDAAADTSARYTQSQRTAIQEWRAAWETLRERANELGLPISKFEGGYVPHMTVDPLEFVQRMEVMGKSLGLNLDLVNKQRYSDVPDEAIQSLLSRAESGDPRAAEYVQGLKMSRGDDVTNVAEAREALNGMLDLSRTGHRLETSAGRSMTREGRIPEWLLEKDASKLFLKWAHSTFRHAHMRRGLDELRSAAAAMSDVAPEAAGYVTRLVEDLVGVRAGSVAASQGEFMQRAQLRLLRAARREGDTLKGATYTQLAKLPELIPFFTAQVYPYALGAKVDKLVQNVLQPFVLTLPAIGVQNVDLILKGLVSTAKQFLENPRGLQEFLVSKGLAPADQPFEAHRWLRDGLERSAVKRLGRNALDAVNHAAMFLYQQTDVATRLITYNASKEIAKELAQGTPRAMKILQEAGPGWRAEIQSKLAAGKDVTQDVAEWMNGYTMFNYNRVSMSEYGRFMGSLFSTFSKWPTSIAGDLSYRFDRVASGEARLAPEMLKIGMKYLGPWMGLLLVQKAVEDDLKESPQAQAVVGKNIAGAAPIGSAGSLLEGGPMFSAPAPRMVTDLAKGALAGDPRAVALTGARNLMPFVPGGFLARIMYHDAPMWFGDAPEKGGVARQLMQDAGLDMDKED